MANQEQSQQNQAVSPYYCHTCRKKFKNQGTLDSHLTSSKHRHQLELQQSQLVTDHAKHAESMKFVMDDPSTVIDKVQDRIQDRPQEGISILRKAAADFYDNGSQDHAIFLYRKLIEFIKKRLIALRQLPETERNLPGSGCKNSEEHPSAHGNEGNLASILPKEKEQLRETLFESYLYLARLALNRDRIQAIDHYNTSISLFFRSEDIDLICETIHSVAGLEMSSLALYNKWMRTADSESADDKNRFYRNLLHGLQEICVFYQQFPQKIIIYHFLAAYAAKLSKQIGIAVSEYNQAARLYTTLQESHSAADCYYRAYICALENLTVQPTTSNSALYTAMVDSLYDGSVSALLLQDYGRIEIFGNEISKLLRWDNIDKLATPLKIESLKFLNKKCEQFSCTKAFDNINDDIHLRIIHTLIDGESSGNQRQVVDTLTAIHQLCSKP